MIGQTLAHYKILEKIGSGGMGDVYLAMDVKLHRRVALKFLPEELTRDADRRDRFVREARAAAAIDHPNIAAIHDIDEVNGQTFIVMEYVEGRSLRECIRPDGMPLGECLDIVLPIAEALAKAHEHGVVHRDVKPDNIQIAEDGYPKLVDFGLAKLQETPSASEEATGFRTSEGMVMGTAAYMSPEQARGENVDARTDIFALGVVLYEMLTGRSPFSRRSTVESLSAVLKEEPPPVGVPEPDRILEMALAKEPGNRYQSMKDFALDLNPLRETSEPSTRSSGRFLMAAMAAVLLGAIALYLLLGRGGVQPGVGLSGRPAVVILYFENNSGDEEIRWLSKGLPSMLLTDLSQTPGLDVVSGQRVAEILNQIGAANVEAVDKSIAGEVARRSGAGAVVVGSIFKSGEEIRIDVQVEDVASGTVLSADSVRGTEVFPLVDELTRRIRSSLRVPEVRTPRRLADISTHSIEAYRLWAEGREAATNVREADARRLYEEAVRRDPGFAMAHFDLSLLLRQAGYPSLAQDHKERVLANLDRLSERDRLYVEGRYSREDGDPTRAIRLLEQLVARYPDETIGFIELGRIYGAQGEHEQVLSALERGVEANPAAGNLRNNLGYALLRLDRPSEALNAFREYQRLEPGEANPYDSQAEVYLLLGQPERAVDRIDQALQIDPSFNAARFVRIWANAMLGRYEDVMEELSPFLEQQVRDGFRPEWQRFFGACVLTRVGRYSEAGQEIERGRQLAIETRDVGLIVEFSLLAAWFALERGDNGSAIQNAETAIVTTKELSNPIWSLNQTVIGHLLAGAGEARRGRLGAAREHLEAFGRASDRGGTSHRFWYHVLEGEIALAEGDGATAKRVFLASEPQTRTFFQRRDWAYSMYSNNLPFRDGIARTEAALGNYTVAASAYRTLLASAERPNWRSWLEPRHVLALARLLDQMGDSAGARFEYERFLELWKNADAGLPELDEARAYVSTLDADNATP